MKTVLIGLAALFATSAIAQSNPASPNPNPPPANPTPTQQQQQQVPPQNAQPRSGTSQQRDGTQQTGAPTPFDTLDPTHAGYIMRDQANSDVWLAQHFAQCDADGDARVTRQEYAKCTQSTRR